MTRKNRRGGNSTVLAKYTCRIRFISNNEILRAATDLGGFRIGIYENIFNTVYHNSYKGRIINYHYLHMIKGNS